MECLLGKFGSGKFWSEVVNSVRVNSQGSRQSRIRVELALSKNWKFGSLVFHVKMGARGSSLIVRRSTRSRQAPSE